MTSVDLAALILPPTVWAEVLKLLATIEEAESVQALNFANQHAREFVLGLEAGGGLLAADIEALYIGLDTAAQLRHVALRDA